MTAFFPAGASEDEIAQLSARLPECTAQIHPDIADLAQESPEIARRVEICRECAGLKRCPLCGCCDAKQKWITRIRYGRCSKFKEETL